MLFRRKKYTNSERFEGFRSQITYDCKGKLKTQFFDLDRQIDESFIEYLKPFGHPVVVAGGIYEIRRDNYFKILLPVGQNAFQVKYDGNSEPAAETALIRQVQRAVSRDLSPELAASCPENAIFVENNAFTIDLRKCTFCLKCV